MSEYIMNRESLKRHCEAMCYKFKNVPTNRAYMEHRLVLDLLGQTRWIPVSERLPENGRYLVEDLYNGEPSISIRSFAKDLDKVDDFDFPKHKGGWYDYDSEYGYWEDTAVIAWMPLPKPYRAESEGANENHD